MQNTNLDARSKVAFITPSYLPDLDIATDLCKSLDKFFKSDFEHYICVPGWDLRKFKHLNSAHRFVLSSDKLLKPYGIFRLPTPTLVHIPGIIKQRINTNWWKFGYGRLSGWIVQQILKLNAPQITECETIVCVDSDLVLAKPVTAEMFEVDGRLRLHRYGGPLPTENHRVWRQRAIEMLGIPPEEAEEEGFIGNLITWKRSNLLKMYDRIQEVTGEHWVDAIARRKFLSEYMLYGFFCRYILGDEGGHALERFEGVHSLWTTDPDQWQRFLNNIEPRHIAIHIQSTITKDAQYRRSIIDKLNASLAH